MSGQDRKFPPAPGTNQIAGFREFRPLTSQEKNNYIYFFVKQLGVWSVSENTLNIFIVLVVSCSWNSYAVTFTFQKNDNSPD